MANYQEVEVVEDESYTQEINLTNKRNTTAKLWKHFGLRLDKNNKASDMSNPVCHLCNTCVFVQQVLPLRGFLVQGGHCNTFKVLPQATKS